MKIVSVSEMKAFEKAAHELGWSYDQMMKAAGEGAADVLLSLLGYVEKRTAVGLVGSGNNGGDTLIALAAMAQAGWDVRAYLVRPRPDADKLIQGLVESGGQIASTGDDPDLARLGEWLEDAVLLIDGVLGTGVQLPLKAEIAQVLTYVGRHPAEPFVAAMDCPSGVDCDSGAAAKECLPADITLCMAAVKGGLLKFPAFERVGDLRVVEIGFPENLPGWQDVSLEVVDDQMVHDILPVRRRDAHKGTFGTALVVAGSVNYTGAALLASLAAHRAGAGMVRLAAPALLHAVLAGQMPEVVWTLLPHDQGVISELAYDVFCESLEKITAVLLGPGWGQEETTGNFLKKLVEGKGVRPARTSLGFIGSERREEPAVADGLPPLVIDADALKLLSRIPDWYKKLPALTVLTPHPGEMAALSGLSTAEIGADRIEIARKFARTWGHVLVLKGALTVIAEPGGQARVIPVATSALAHAGTGDVLAGLITGLRAQGVPAFEAAVAGAWIHAQAGLQAADDVGHEAAVLAGDVLSSIPDVLSQVW